VSGYRWLSVDIGGTDSRSHARREWVGYRTSPPPRRLSPRHTHRAAKEGRRERCARGTNAGLAAGLRDRLLGDGDGPGAYGGVAADGVVPRSPGWDTGDDGPQRGSGGGWAGLSTSWLDTASAPPDSYGIPAATERVPSPTRARTAMRAPPWDLMLRCVCYLRKVRGGWRHVSWQLQM